MLTELRPKVGQIVDTMVELRPKVGQIVDSAIELRPKVQAVFDNLVETTATVRSEVQRVDATVNGRDGSSPFASDFVPTKCSLRTFESRGAYSDVVTRTVVSPVRQVTGIVRGVTAGS